MMKIFVTICALAVLLIAAAPASAILAELVDLGTVAGETGPLVVSISDWGPVQPTTSGGGWGGLASDPLSYDNLCRTVWSTGNTSSAYITFSQPIIAVDIRHLDGIANDDFEVYVDGVKWGGYTSNPSQTEYWLTTGYYGTAGYTLEIRATGAQWSGFGTYGQLGIDRVWAAAVPEPATLALLGLGGLFLRRRK